VISADINLFGNLFGNPTEKKKSVFATGANGNIGNSTGPGWRLGSGEWGAAFGVAGLGEPPGAWLVPSRSLSTTYVDSTAIGRNPLGTH